MSNTEFNVNSCVTLHIEELCSKESVKSRLNIIKYKFCHVQDENLMINNILSYSNVP
jgi:hypothetical protein